MKAIQRFIDDSETAESYAIFQVKTEPQEALIDTCRLNGSDEVVLQNDDTCSMRPTFHQENNSSGMNSAQEMDMESTSKPFAQGMDTESTSKPSEDGEVTFGTLPHCKIVPSTIGSEKLVDFSFQLEQAVARPKCPTISCSINSSDRSLFASPLVQWTAKSVDIGPSNEHIKDIICGVSTPAEVRLQGRDTLQLDNSFYWCNFCPFKAVTKEDFVSHVAIHRFSCKFCRFQAFSRAEVVRHTCVEHPNSSEAPWQFCSFFHDSLKIKLNKTGQNEGKQNGSSPGHLNMMVVSSEENVLDDTSNKPSLTTSETENHSIKQNIAHQEASVGMVFLESSDGTQHSWTCGYCDFVTLNYNLLKFHCSIWHPSLTVLAKVSTATPILASEISKLDSDRQLHFEKGRKAFLPSEDSARICEKESLTKLKETPVTASPQAEIDLKILTHRELDQPLVHKKLPITINDLKETERIYAFKCYYCHKKTLEIEGLKTHLETYHKGEAYIAVDLKAVRLKKARHIVFCGIIGCQFHCQFQDEYFQHYKTWHSDWSSASAVSSMECHSIEQTMLFSKKMRTNAKHSKKWMYSCQYCQFKCMTSEQIKSHVTTMHEEFRSCYYTLEPYHNGGQKSSVIHFCPICKYFESRRVSEVIHHGLSHN